MKEGVSFIHWIHNYFWCVDVAGRLQNMKKKMFINWIFLTVLLTFDSMELNFVLFGFYFVKKFFKNHAWINPLIDWHVDVVAKRMKRSGDFCWFFFFFLVLEVLERVERGAADQDSGIVRGPTATAQQHGQLRLERQSSEIGAGRPDTAQGLFGHFDCFGLEPLLNDDVLDFTF